MMMLARVRRLFGVALLMALGGCATYDRMNAPPAPAQPIVLNISGEGASGWNDVTIGTYTVPDSDVVISGYQRGNAGFLFGVIGVLAQDAIQSSNGAAAVKNVRNALTLHLAPQTVALTQKAIASGAYGQAFSAPGDAGGPKLTVVPYVVLTFVNDTDVMPYVILKTTLSGTGHDWTTRYIASSGQPTVLEGENSLTADGGKKLKAALDRDLDWAVKAMLDDIANHRPRDPAHMIYVETGVPFIRQRMGLPGFELSEDGETLVYVPKVADAVVFSGVFVLDKAAVAYRPATPDDKGKMLDTGD
jgi:hypothetical protein